VSIFEDFSYSIAKELGKRNPWVPKPFRVEPFRTADRQLAVAFAHRSLDLERLSVSYMIQAEHFFLDCPLDWSWPRLQCLALTSPCLRQTSSYHDIDYLLQKAGVAALQMPALRTLVIWNGRKKIACAFVYQQDRDSATVSWRGTRQLHLSADVLKVWKRVAEENHPSRRSFHVRNETIYDEIRSHGDAIHHLNLPCEVVSPASLWQIRSEERAGERRR